MLENNYFARLRALLFEKGISSRQSEHLIEELQDHLALKVEAFQAQGNNPADSERLAMELMGTPEDIAEKSAADSQGGRLMRHAWLLCGAGLFLASFLVRGAAIVLGYYFAGGYEYDNGESTQVSLPILQVEVVLFNWLPLLIGMGALALLIRFSSIGWKSIFFTAVVLGVAASAVEIRMAISAIADSDQLCFLEVDDSFILQWLRLGSGISREHGPICLTMFKLFAPLGMCFFARYVQPRLSQQAGKILSP